MFQRGKRVLDAIVHRVPGFRIAPETDFHSDRYLALTHRRLEHLATLNLRIEGRTVLEVGAGIGDFTSFFLARGCRVIASDGRTTNVAILRRRFPSIDVRLFDVENGKAAEDLRAEVVCCYGLLYHLSRPVEALRLMGQRCDGFMLVETCVSCGEEFAVNPVYERRWYPSQAISGTGCRPTRRWVRDELRRSFPHVYMPTTQPWHPEFPADWTAIDSKELTRAIFVASREAINNPLLTESIPERQSRA
jgi:SAM-dependent methyltransferase